MSESATLPTGMVGMEVAAAAARTLGLPMGPARLVVLVPATCEVLMFSAILKQQCGRQRRRARAMGNGRRPRVTLEWIKSEVSALCHRPQLYDKCVKKAMASRKWFASAVAFGTVGGTVLWAQPTYKEIPTPHAGFQDKDQVCTSCRARWGLGWWEGCQGGQGQAGTAPVPSSFCSQCCAHRASTGPSGLFFKLTRRCPHGCVSALRCGVLLLSLPNNFLHTCRRCCAQCRTSPCPPSSTQGYALSLT